MPANVTTLYSERLLPSLRLALYGGLSPMYVGHEQACGDFLAVRKDGADERQSRRPPRTRRVQRSRRRLAPAAVMRWTGEGAETPCGRRSGTWSRGLDDDLSPGGARAERSRLLAYLNVRSERAAVALWRKCDTRVGGEDVKQYEGSVPDLIR
jgi:hypothetical protein